MGPPSSFPCNDLEPIADRFDNNWLEQTRGFYRLCKFYQACFVKIDPGLIWIWRYLVYSNFLNCVTWHIFLFHIPSPEIRHTLGIRWISHLSIARFLCWWFKKRRTRFIRPKCRLLRRHYGSVTWISGKIALYTIIYRGYPADAQAISHGIIKSGLRL